MATKKRRKSASVSEKLSTEAHKFNFFQATRLLQGVVRLRPIAENANPVGYDTPPNKEALHFSVPSALNFQANELVKIDYKLTSNTNTEQPTANMQVSFMGLNGPSSVLPVFFTEMELIRQREKDTALKNFLDIFNHRLISLFYRAWEKYRLPFQYERYHLLGQEKDPISHAMESLAGIDNEQIKQSLPIHEEELLFYTGLYACPSRSASALQASLSDYLGVEVLVNQFKGEWLDLLEDDRSRLPAFPRKGQNNCLGVDMIIGEKYFAVEGKFELEIGPLNHSEFQDLLPGTAKHQALLAFTKMFAGANFEFDLKYKIYSDAIDDWTLDDEKSGLFQLGRNTWLAGAGSKAGFYSVSVPGE